MLFHLEVIEIREKACRINKKDKEEHLSVLHGRKAERNNFTSNCYKALTIKTPSIKVKKKSPYKNITARRGYLGSARDFISGHYKSSFSDSKYIKHIRSR